MESDKTERELPNIPTDSISKLTFSQTSNTLLVSSWDRSVSLYNTDSCDLVSRFTGNAAILDCTFYNTPQTAVWGGLDRHLQLHDFERNHTENLGDHDYVIKAIRFYSQIGLIISGSWDSTMRSWDPRTQSHWVSTTSLPGKAYSLAISENQGYIVLGTNKKEILIFDIRNLQEPIQRKESPLKYQTRYIECMPNGLGYAIASIEGRVGLEYFSSAPEMQVRNYAFKCHRKEENGKVLVYPVNTITFHPVFGTFATGGSDNLVNVWDGEHKKRIWKLKEYPSPISSLSFNKDGKQLAIGCSYMFEEGDIPNKPPEKIFIKEIDNNDVMPKSKE